MTGLTILTDDVEPVLVGCRWDADGMPMGD